MSSSGTFLWLLGRTAAWAEAPACLGVLCAARAVLARVVSVELAQLVCRGVPAGLVVSIPAGGFWVPGREESLGGGKPGDVLEVRFAGRDCCKALKTREAQHLPSHSYPLGASFTRPSTLEQHGLELRSSTYTWVFLFLERLEGWRGWRSRTCKCGRRGSVGLGCCGGPPPSRHVAQGSTVASCVCSFLM